MGLSLTPIPLGKVKKDISQFRAISFKKVLGKLFSENTNAARIVLGIFLNISKDFSFFNYTVIRNEKQNAGPPNV